MRHTIATVSLSGRLEDKLEAVAEAGFDGIEIFDPDLVTCPLSPARVAARCRELGLSIDLFQPLRDVQGVPPEQFGGVLHRLERKLAVMGDLGVTTALVCSNVRADSVPDPGVSADQLHRAGELAAAAGVRLAFEALAWGRHIRRVGEAWDAVIRADHPAVTLAVDTFHLLARGDTAASLGGIPGGRIGFLQVADAPLLDMNPLDWSRHHRCFPGQGTLDVVGVVAAVLEAGYAGPLSLEVFSDVVREAPPAVTALDARRSLLYLEAQLADRAPRAAGVQLAPAPAAPVRVDPAFVEIVQPAGDPAVPALLSGLGFAEAGRHATKPVTWWRNGEAHVVLNEGEPTPGPRAAAIGVATPDVAAVARRAAALRWPGVDRTRGAGEAVLPGIASPSGLHLFVSGPVGGPECWQDDFVPVASAPVSAPSSAPPPDGASYEPPWGALDHVGMVVDPDQLNEEVGFLRAVFGLAPSALEEFMEPAGRMRSRALRPTTGCLRVVLNVEDTDLAHAPRPGVNQLAFACADVLAAVRALGARGVPLVRPPDNYYADLAARFELPEDRVEELRSHRVFYDRAGEGELLHAYTDVLVTGCYVELLERLGGYDGYGSANTYVRLAVQR